MGDEVTILLAEDDDGHAALVERNLKRAGIVNQIIRFRNGLEVKNFLFQDGKGAHIKPGVAYLLLLDIRMPVMGGIELLEMIKSDAELKKLPVIMVTTTDDPKEVERCHELGCNNYVIKPVDYERFVKAMQQLGLFLKVVKIPAIVDQDR